MPTVTITWDDINDNEDGFNIYRSTTPLDTVNPANLPAPLATVAAGIGTYDDTTAASDTTYYYAVAAYKGSFVNPAVEVQVDTAPPPPPEHKYWRVKIEESHETANLKVDIAEVDLRAEVGVAGTPSGTVFASSAESGYGPADAFDGNTSTRWLAQDGSKLPQWIGMNFDSPVEIKQVALTSGIVEQRMPIRFTVEYSDDGVSWGTAAQITEQPAWAEYETRTYAVDLATFTFDYTVAAPGELLDGGVYAGTMLIDGVNQHLIFADDAGERTAATAWKTSQTSTPGTSSLDDGRANTDAMIAAGIADHPAAEHCVNYADEMGNDDYYLPALNELAKAAAIRGMDGIANDMTQFRWSSSEASATDGWNVRFSDGTEFAYDKDFTGRYVRPIRRIPV